MYLNKKITVVLPCRNEGSHLAEVVKRVPEFVDEIIVVSNKSTDDTVEVAKKLGVSVLEDNRTIKGIGYGFAHITGIAAAKGDIICCADGDATYPLGDLDKTIVFLLAGKLDFVSCNRYPLQPGVKIPFKLRFGVWVLNIETRILYGIKINDILSGMWVFKSSSRNQLGLTMGDWNLSPQIKINAATNKKIKFSEFSIAQYARQGETKQSYFATGMSHMLWIIRNRLGFYKAPKPDEA